MNLHEKHLGRAMFELWDLLNELGHPFDSWPDKVKWAVSDAIIDRSPPTEADLLRTMELVEEGKLPG